MAPPKIIAARVNIGLTEEQFAWLRSEARRLQMPIGELLRRLVAEAMRERGDG